MKVTELIETLEKMPQDANIMICGSKKVASYDSWGCPKYRTEYETPNEVTARVFNTKSKVMKGKKSTKTDTDVVLIF